MEEKNFVIFIFTYYHKDLLREILTDNELSNDYSMYERLEKLAEEFNESGFDNEDYDIEDTTEMFLKNKIKEI